MDPPTVDCPTNGPTNEITASSPMYSPEQEEYNILSIAQEAAELFPTGKVYKNIKELRKELGEFGQKRICCHDGRIQATVHQELRTDGPNNPKREDEFLRSHSIGKRTFPSSTRFGSFQNISFADAEPKRSQQVHQDHTVPCLQTC
jgi:hypothetical protein